MERLTVIYCKPALCTATSFSVILKVSLVVTHRPTNSVWNFFNIILGSVQPLEP